MENRHELCFEVLNVFSEFHMKTIDGSQQEHCLKTISICAIVLSY